MSGPNVIPLYLLPRGAQPRPHEPLRYDEVKVFRFIECHGYAGCLNFAAHAEWSGFHCQRCPFFEAHLDRLKVG